MQPDKALDLSRRVGLARVEVDRAYESRAALSVAISQALQAAGLAASGGPVLGEVVRPGQRVLLKPNWVREVRSKPGDLTCLYTNHALTLSVLALVIECSPASVTIADAPIQGCDFDGVVGAEFKAAATRAASGMALSIRDLRQVRLGPGGLRAGRQQSERGADDYVDFDLGDRSSLEPITTPDSEFRVTMYDPRRTRERHGLGKHQYVIAREVIEADVIINLPKLKTHKKTGLTGALKNLVGTVGSKDCLTHHRRGGTADGGDCYPGRDWLRGWVERLFDDANQHVGTQRYSVGRGAANKLFRLAHLLGRPTDVEGSWHGNDTCWRMVHDLNVLARCGCLDGTVADHPQRRMISIVDAVVAGQGEGPLRPDPLELGLVLAGADSFAIDYIGALLLQMDPRKLPVVWSGIASTVAERPPQAVLEDEFLDDATLVRRLGQPAVLPTGWRDHLEHPLRTARHDDTR